MKYFKLLSICLIVTAFTNSYACQIQVPTSEAQRYIDALPSGVPPLFKCEDKPEEKCHCVDDVVWETAEFVDNEVVDYIKKVDAVSCEKLVKPEVIEGEEALPFNEYQDCDDKFEALVCKDKEEKIKNYDQLEVYCAKEIMKIDGKKLVNSEAKKAQKEAEKQAAKELEESNKAAKKALKLSIKDDIKNATTVAKLKAVIEKMIEVGE